MNRKDKTVKQLQAECRKRKVGFMMNWTKIALTKRLEDEDRKDKELLEAENVKKEQDKEINKLKAAIKSGIKKAEEKKDSEILEIKNKMSSLPSMEKKMGDLQLRKIQEKGKLEIEYDKFRDEYTRLRKRLHELSDLKIKKADEIAALTIFITSLK